MANSSLLMNVAVGETRVALTENGTLGELYVERRRERSPVGNIYLGKVTRVLPGMQAAFIDVGLDRAAFLHVEDLQASPKEKAEEEEEKGADKGKRGRGNRGRSSKRASRKTPIRDLLTEGQSLMVQVSKGPIGTKGARVTTHVALPGRHVVFMPGVDHVGVSKRIANEPQRQQLKELVQSIKPEAGGVMVTHVGEGLTLAQLKADIGYLVKVWEGVQAQMEAAKSSRQRLKVPRMIHEEPDLPLRVTRDLFTENIDEIVVDDPHQHERIVRFVEMFLPARVKDVTLYEGEEPLFDEFGVEAEIARALSRKVALPSGGYLIIDQAEALTAIDVNTGRFTGKGKNVAETIFQTNLEAVNEIAYQLRFRNIGGLIVLDFIDMDKSSHRDKVYKALLRELKKDAAKTTAVRISELGLVEMTRKRTRESLGRMLYEPCFYCDGTGFLKSKTTVCHEIFRQLRRERSTLPGYKIVVTAHPAVCDALEREEKEALEAASQVVQRRIELRARRDYHLEQFDLTAG
ncbi:MAG: Rne/Rng family ribonuclease [Sandaracinus sp.]|nr:Rne/Rng family ribonuclease [Sandaracinus sp.]|tara:strand:- start:3391 stop:4944 length:1554 start_codon:yes stop_codon:yes gene_type:complete